MELVFPHLFVPWFRSVAPYIHAHKGKTFVIGIASELIAAGRLAHFVQDLALIHSLGIKIVLTHGFRLQVEEQLATKGHASRFVNGIRITDEAALDAAQEAAGQLRYQIEAAFSQGLPNTPMAHAQIRVLSGNYITAKPLGIVDGVNFEQTGLVRKLDSVGIQRALEQNAIVLLSPFGFSPTGEAFNLTMEDVASQAAAALKADKLIFVTEIKGISETLAKDEQQQTPQAVTSAATAPPAPATDENSGILHELSLHQAEDLLAKLPDTQQPTDAAYYLKYAVKASQNGVERVHIIPYAVDGGLLMEIFTHDGIGTMIVDEKLDSLREARSDDVGGIIQLIEPLEKDGILVKRSRTDIERDISAYTVIEHDGVLFGCAAFYPYPQAKTGEMAALTVLPQAQGQGDGDRLLKRIEQRARALGFESIFVLTTRTMHWFIKRGFEPVKPEWLPETRLKKYNWERRSQVLVKRLDRIID